ncbi:N-(5'-phosphoribosyl)anthranilate isomerase [Aureimonas sp. SA4125]|uniref:phosphoribosylanthranilate isomerase n=1 Tax=Aureimonas sp. SA4125 TaxID=2826993 RepID=UPI001CC4B6FB|nr:phosphoribosylanthranilate isomerase [Aureimonas sp. SA4125]BDA86932.1 N-(5'-phosphoribosyl)anthranilate isomerase [Aureimonas sp. SA4125]
MTPLDIKICGLRTPETIAAALERGASHVGFIHFEKSPRHLSVAQMAALRPRVAAPARLVVVTVDPDDATIEAIADWVRPDMIQLHGHETPERVAEIRQRTGIPVMKALSIGTAGDLQTIDRYRGIADRILLDAKRPKGSVLPGGNGVSFDWALLAALDAGAEYMLSGGLDAGNIAEALSRTQPSGLDVSSGVESAPGIKDTGLIHGFFDALDQARMNGAGLHPERSAS